jgi:hypothetical protein
MEDHHHQHWAEKKSFQAKNVHNQIDFEGLINIRCCIKGEIKICWRLKRESASCSFIFLNWESATGFRRKKNKRFLA